MREICCVCSGSHDPSECVAAQRFIRQCRIQPREELAVDRAISLIRDATLGVVRAIDPDAKLITHNGRQRVWRVPHQLPRNNVSGAESTHALGPTSVRDRVAGGHGWMDVA